MLFMPFMVKIGSSLASSRDAQMFLNMETIHTRPKRFVPAVRPPSMTRTAPDMNVDSSEAR
jgi:hypothetical protein